MAAATRSAARPCAQCAIFVVGLELEAVLRIQVRSGANMTSDSQLRWIGPDKGAIHLPDRAIVNAVWESCSRKRGQATLALFCDFSPEELVRAVDFRYYGLHHAGRGTALVSGQRRQGRTHRDALRRQGFPATPVGGLARLSDDKIRALCADAVATAFRTSNQGRPQLETTAAGVRSY